MSSIIGGSAFGVGDALVDTRGAVLLENVHVVAVGATRNGVLDEKPSYGLELEGRVNKSSARSKVFYLMDADGCAAVVSEILGLAARAGTYNEVAALIQQRIDAMPKSGKDE